jgi:(p)ppGpp synthase/HD superfamily hydrolase
MFSEGVERALRAAEAAHRGQVRKGSSDVPYVTHPIHCAIVLARLGHRDEVLEAALLHDVVEDCDGWTIARVEREFGGVVASIVAELTEDKTKSWEERKRGQVEHVATMSAEALAVKAADKLHNLRTLCRDLEAAPDPRIVWNRFTGGRERTLAMSRALVDALRPRVEPSLAHALEEAMSALECDGTRREPLP